MAKKVFSVANKGLFAEEGDVYLFDFEKEGEEKIVASNKEYEGKPNDIYTLPSTLIRQPKTDEELAEEYLNNKKGIFGIRNELKLAFLAGRKSVGGEFHLTREQVESIYFAAMGGKTFEGTLQSLKQSIYPHIITVENDGEKYYWETLKAEY